MPTGEYIHAKYFEFATDDPSDADRSLAGSHWLRGVILWWKLAPSAPADVEDAFGNLLIRNGDASTGATGDILLEIPVVAKQAHGAAQTTLFTDSDSYIRFTDGFYLDATTPPAGLKHIFDAYNFTLLYT